ncbi:hypothetical protein N658DRAFT_436256 [Parathielavia hyrcaniae]|uniref:Apple domain-containing protein n=1 Tax=Parathielavia hyrcaniae TaxID=113614 RepID=A0AAN6PRE5_9PEZI|nr:hypothetical protein N658DRAFT_436256 [Parathielavia hyrcaniae]
MDPSPHRGAPSRPLPGDNNDSINDLVPPRVRFAEGTPQAVSYKTYQSSSRPDSPSAATASSAALRPGPGPRPAPSQPAVYWDGDDDRDSDISPAGYTFYREGTPPPPEYEALEKHRGYGGAVPPATTEGSTAGGGTISSDRAFTPAVLSQGQTSNWSLATSNDGASPITKKRVLWVLIAAGVLIIIGVAVGVGVGLGLGLSRTQGSAAEPAVSSSSVPAPASEVNPAQTSPSTHNPTNTEAAAETTAGPAPKPRPTYNSDCPALNNTIYHVPGSTRSFLRLCGIDYTGSGATDITHAYTESMADCMHSCASLDQCTACSWGYIEGDKGSMHRCYMKKDLKQSHAAAADWCFAILH